ncbi:hypothetical protein HY641_01865 [Candidatus Woesearchaeota archaeon]|nr:hypothetical protein [Candidatus Woesearchaeota archaeon]
MKLAVIALLILISSCTTAPLSEVATPPTETQSIIPPQDAISTITNITARVRDLTITASGE